ncbi:DUF6215 domain-containing protein [Streptomyces decoyicus]|uniref:DUF6215 domain-containing protein n=1 Tax=Streptomyces decoyicus TaxID=249567 RepID=UPI00069ED6B7|nr:DUF6215 domain-containing protein [Streptomyces decoyicus]KOG50441.1 hypothetical protein ADK74_01900 [Streptomyces decoyicus]QZY14967.1 DUF6215 domain-containing protein [Streptomyces decoyicus]
MADDIDAAVTGAGAVGQAIAAVALVAALGVGLWTVGESSSPPDSAPSPATCSGGEPEKAAGEPGKAPRQVSGAQLCKALNRPDLAELLGTPGETAKTAGGSGSSTRLGNGKEIATPSAQVEFGTYTVSLAATYDRHPVAGSAGLLGEGAQQRKVLGRPAVFYADRTISISFRLDGKDSDSGPGVPARTLTVARDANDSGGSFEVSLWRTDGGVPDDAVLLRVAEKVLPTVPWWAAGA